jgi:hypothetical protein
MPACSCADGHAIESWSNGIHLLFHAAAMLFYIVQEITVTKFQYFFEGQNHTSFQDRVLSGASVAATS